MQQSDRQPTQQSQIGRYSGYGITLGVATALFAWLGLKLDARFGTQPLFVLLGTFLGFGTAFYRMYRDLVVLPRRRSQAAGGDAGTDRGAEG